MGTWSTTDKTSGTALSQSNLLADLSGGSNAVRGTTSVAGGQVYFQLTTNASTASLEVGIGNASEPLTANGSGRIIGQDTNGVASYDGSGHIFFNNAFNSVIGATFQTGSNNVLDFAIDFGASLYWYRVNNANWNNNASANPSTGAGGASFSGIASGPYFIMAAANAAGTGQTVLYNDGNTGTAFTNTIPSGFSAWAAGKPLTASLTGSLATAANDFRSRGLSLGLTGSLATLAGLNNKSLIAHLSGSLAVSANSARSRSLVAGFSGALAEAAKQHASHALQETFAGSVALAAPLYAIRAFNWATLGGYPIGALSLGSGAVGGIRPLMAALVGAILPVFKLQAAHAVAASMTGSLAAVFGMARSRALAMPLTGSLAETAILVRLRALTEGWAGSLATSAAIVRQRALAAALTGSLGDSIGLTKGGKPIGAALTGSLAQSFPIQATHVLASAMTGSLAEAANVLRSRSLRFSATGSLAENSILHANRALVVSMTGSLAESARFNVAKQLSASITAGLSVASFAVAATKSRPLRILFSGSLIETSALDIKGHKPIKMSFTGSLGLVARPVNARLFTAQHLLKTMPTPVPMLDERNLITPTWIRWLMSLLSSIPPYKS